MPSTTVLLDLDGVIRHFDDAHLASVERQHGLPAGALAETAFESQLLHAVITGRISRAEWVAEVGRRLGHPGAASEWLAHTGAVDEPMLAEVDALRSRGVVVAVLTNGTDTIGAEVEQLGLRTRFDGIFNSADIGYAKPDRRAFEHVCSRLAVEPSSVFFSDDSEANLSGALEIGMTARLFADVATFRHHLVEVGLAAG